MPLFDSGAADTFLYYVMPFIEGETLKDRIARERHLPVDEAVRIGIEVADALDYAHRHGIVHRDVKPANVLLHEGRVLVADFGIALAVRRAGGERLTETGLSMGTPHYMSPEQATADSEADARSDVYSLGTVVYEMLAGRPPHDGSSLQAVIAAVLTKTPPPVNEDRASIPKGLAAVVHRSIERLPADRFQSAAEFAEALEEPEPYATGASGVSPARAARKERGLWAAAVVGLLAALFLDFASSPTQSDVAGPVRFVLQLPYLNLREDEQRIEVSPDGSTLYFVAWRKRLRYPLPTKVEHARGERSLPHGSGALARRIGKRPVSRIRVTGPTHRESDGHDAGDGHDPSRRDRWCALERRRSLRL